MNQSRTRQQLNWTWEDKRYVCWPRKDPQVGIRLSRRSENDPAARGLSSHEDRDASSTALDLLESSGASHDEKKQRTVQGLSSDGNFADSHFETVEIGQETVHQIRETILNIAPPANGEAQAPIEYYLPIGPYMLIRPGTFVTVYQLMDDTYDIFSSTFQPQEPTPWNNLPRDRIPYEQLQAIASHGLHKAAAVLPGAFEINRFPEKRLKGMLMAVKDMFDICNHKTSLGSRAFHRISEPSERTAPAIQVLVDAGATLLGTTHMCAMMGKQEPMQSVDYQAPFNPRADGFQSPSGGSSGSAAAVAAYSWLDLAIGSDSTVSGRMPAQANGCFSFRPSTGAVSTSGMFSAVPRFDTPCVFARELGVLKSVIETWIEPEVSRSTRSTALHYLTDSLPTEVPAQIALIEDFVGDFANFLACDVKRSSIQESWSDSFARWPDDADIAGYLDLSVANETYVYDVWQKVSRFVDDHRRIVGEDPFMPLPGGIHLWDDVKNTTQEQSDKAWAKLDFYKKWLMNELKLLDQDAIVIMPLEAVKPRYRDEWPETPRRQQMWDPLLLAPIFGAPEIVVPIGQLSFDSRISGKAEHLPVCVSVMGAPGKDHELLDIVTKFLHSSKRQTSVMAGRTMF